MANRHQSIQAPQVTHSNFFVLRTPMLPVGELVEWGTSLSAARAGKDQPAFFENAWKEDVQLLRERLRVIAERPEILHALYVATPSLQTGIEHWKRDPDSKKGLQAERALVRYFARMAARATPFGLFSGCSVGRVNDRDEKTSLMLKPRSDYRLCCRPDFNYLFALTAALRKDPALELELEYWPNSSLHRVADAWYYTESRLSDDKRTHHLVKVESDQYLEAVIETAHSGATVAQLVCAVVGTPGEADPSEEEARAYVLELIRDNEILVSNLSPLLTGAMPLDDLIGQLEALPSGTATAGTLRQIRAQLKSLEVAGLSATPNDYSAITARLEELPAKVEPTTLYQVDMIKPVEQAVLGKNVIEEMIRGVGILSQIGQTGEAEDLTRFREAFSARYELAMVPLLDALDEESGIGFGSSANRTDASPLLRGLQLKKAEEADWNSKPIGVHPAFLRQIVECIKTGKSELELDLDQFGKDNAPPPNLADAFCVMGTLIAPSPDLLQSGEFEFYVHGAFGPSGARLLGRFCHEDPQIDSGVRDHLRQEELHDADAIYAEVVYLPEGRIGNVLCRPVLREYEIPYLGRSGAAPDKQIAVGDLLVGVRRGSIVLHSRRLGKRIVPRVTNAHGFTSPQLSSVYRFLCYLQHQHGASVPGLGWGVLEAFQFVPRIRVGRLILSLARWRLSEAEVDEIGTEQNSRRFAAVQDLRQRRGLPRWVVLQEGDNSLPVDLDNALSVDAFAHVMKRGSQSNLVEMYPSADGACVGSPEGRFLHELNVPFVRKHGPVAKHLETRPSLQPLVISSAETASADERLFPPGSEWLYIKLYGGPGALDETLVGSLPALVRPMLASGSVLQWFYVRYADPLEHLRIRFRGNPAALNQRALPQIFEAFNPLVSSGKLWKIELGTYQREIERYGGTEGMLAAEEIFCADSEAVLDILQQLAGDEGLDIRWRTGLMGIDQLLSDCGLEDEQKLPAVGRWRDGLQNEFKLDAAGKRQFGDRFRAERRKLEALLGEPSGESGEWEFARKAFRRRSLRNLEVFKTLRELSQSGSLTVEIGDLLGSYVHMHINRLLQASQVAHELVLYDFLFQLYESKRARTARRETSASG